MNPSIKKKYSPEEKQSYILRWQESGQTKTTFAKEQGLNYDTFLSWVQRLEGFSNPLAGVTERVPSFVSIQVDGKNPVNHGSLPLMEITLAGGHQIRFYQRVPIDYLRDLLK